MAIIGTSFSETINGSSLNDTIFAEAGNDTVFGNGGADLIFGGSGNDDLRGGAGNDSLAGDFGQDRLTGGSGANTFTLLRVSDSLVGASSHDIVTDFVHGVDKINLNNIDAVPDIAGNQAFRFVGGGAFAFEGDLRAASSGGNTFILGNTDTDASPEFEIQLNGLHTISTSDFVL
jgi:Ca2+-binding RTX toxin-like protein